MTDRRDFLRIGAGVTLGLAGLPAGAQSSSTDAAIRRYVRFGRTDLKISDICFGSSSSSSADLVRHALDRGVNYFDTAESYRWGRSESAIGEGLQGRRDRVFIATKTKAGASDTRADMMKSLEGSLQRLRTDYVDVYYNHSVNDVSRMQNPEWREFTELAKRQGKIRFSGMSGHGGQLVVCLDYAIENDLVDVILVAYNFAQDPSFYDRLRHTFHWSAIQPDLPRVLEKAKSKDIGVMAMKVLMGARLNDMRPYEGADGTFSHAAFRWALSSTHVDAVTVSMTGVGQIDEYVAASGSTVLSGYDRELLDRYVHLQAGKWCQPGCNSCESSCPRGVQISEVLRTRMYAVDYRDALLAKAEYAELGAGASACLNCSGQPCQGACPIDVPIAQFTREAAFRLA
ncbi:MAG TPA: aldo/keto reductase [Burkholderiales bacterium]|nr:aldo/keto reductase [Burkholderiales bacterium]